MHPKTLVLPGKDDERKVKAVQAWGGANFTRRLTFLDQLGEEIDHYEPSDFHFERDGPQLVLENGEELVGIYGTIGEYCDWFTSFGFLIKSKGSNKMTMAAR